MKLPLLDYSATNFGDKDLSNTFVIACQHILETNFVMFEYLFAKGLKPKNTFLLGKCYSSNKEILSKFKKKGVFVHSGSLVFDSHRSFDGQFDLIVQDFLLKIKAKKDFSQYDKIVLIDDGGYLVYWANHLYEGVKNLVAIEQTSSGYTKLRNEDFAFPVINVARSNVKLVYESPFIAEVVIEKMQKQLTKLKLKPKSFLIVGVGSLGNAIFNLLKIKQFNVKKFDINNNSDFKKNSLNSILPQFDAIVGVTGSEIINQESYSNLKKGAILVSASSSDREFSAVNLRKLVSKNNDAHKNIFVRNIYLLNAGFPINFDGSKNSVAPEKIQLTRALIYSAVFFGLKNGNKKGIIELDKEIQTKLVSEFAKISN
ncbi:MAG: hypothetical protein Q7S21_04025 [archaeon]|nr:hypothetical protein [archaeon]